MRNLITTKGAYHEPNHRTTIVHLERCHEEGFWMDMQDPDEEDFKILAGAFKFHPLTIEDVKNRGQRPKLDDYDGYRFMVLFSARWTDAGELETDEYHLYISDDYLVTVHDGPAPLLDQLRRRIGETPAIARGKPEFLAYLVIDAVVDPTFDALQRLDSTIDELEDAIVDRADPEQLRRIYALKHSVTQLRQLLGAERDLFQRLITESLSDPDLGAYYRDVYDHVIRQYESVDSLRDLLTGAMDVYLSTVSNRLNVTMRTLTVIASLFLPITFLTGFYGMNFAYLTSVLEPHQLAFPIAIGTMLAATAFQLYIFKRRGWI
ncbi:MAG TPA: magnesium/cobalt transporter CorA [Candidatus Dormibacteraeota bacterium]|jgi:magnesium transporter